MHFLSNFFMNTLEKHATPRKPLPPRHQGFFNNKPLLCVPLCLCALVAIFIPGKKTKKYLLSSQKYGIHILQNVKNQMGL